MIPLHHLRDLDVAAGSGLCRLGRRLILLADDRRHLVRYDLDHPGPGERLALLPGDTGEAEDKAVKADLEALTPVPGGLLAVPSGSRPHRCRGALLPTVGEDLAGPALAVDFTPLFAHLATLIPELNLEGAALVGGRLHLLQRHSGRGPNALVTVDWAAAREAIARGAPVPAAALLDLAELALPELAGVPLGFTDALALPDGTILFTAAAEDAPDAYEDGRCVGSAVGLLERGAVVCTEPLSGDDKIEGLALGEATPGALDLLLVADLDDPARPTPLYAARLPWPWPRR